jgi:hypothetical protein
MSCPRREQAVLGVWRSSEDGKKSHQGVTTRTWSLTRFENLSRRCGVSSIQQSNTSVEETSFAHLTNR